MWVFFICLHLLKNILSLEFCGERNIAVKKASLINIINVFSHNIVLFSLIINSEEHAGLCVCGGRPGDVAHHESAAEPQTLLHPQTAWAYKDQLNTKWIWGSSLLQHTGACGRQGTLYVFCFFIISLYMFYNIKLPGLLSLYYFNEVMNLVQ